MPHQRQIADVALEVLPSGLFAYKLVVITVPRQSGKTTLDGAVLEHRALVTHRARCWFTMQTGKDASDWFVNEHMPMLEPLAAGYKARRQNGSEHIRWHATGGMVRPFPPTAGALHSKTSDLVIVDEPWAFDLIRGRELDQAIVPTQATKPNAQVWKVSTAGDANSYWWLGTVEAGRAAVLADRREGVAFFEWSCPEDLDPTEPTSWPLYHPAYGLTIGPEAMGSALEQLGPDEFARAYGNVWVATTARVIPLKPWRACGDESQAIPPEGNLSLAFDVALDRSDAAIVAAWTDEGGLSRLEVADYRPGASWVAGRLAELRERWRPVSMAYDAAGPALDVADQCARAGLELEPLDSKSYAAACAGLLESVMADRPTLRYRPHQALDDAVAGASRRALGDRWAWSRRESGVSLACLTAATVARWADMHAVAAAPFRIY